MTTVTTPERKNWLREHSELGICALLVVLGVLVLTDALRIPTDFAQRGPVGPKAVPILVGSLLLIVAALLARDVLRGGKGEAKPARTSTCPHPPTGARFSCCAVLSSRTPR